MSYRADKLVIDGHTDTHTQATTIPEGQNWPRVKMNIQDEMINKDKSCYNYIVNYGRFWFSYLILLHRLKKKYNMKYKFVNGSL